MTSPPNRKERFLLQDLYTLTQTLTQPEITPVLRGSCQMQGPVDETDCDIQLNTVFSHDENELGRHSNSRKVLMRAESGTCNVCSAPCSSCLHINRALMGLKAHEFSDETCQGNAGSQYSVNDVVPVKNTACDGGQHTASETSNVLGDDCFSENAESKASLRTCDVSGASEDVEAHLNLSSGGTVADDQLPLKPQCISDQRAHKNKFEDRKGLESHEDSISCVSGSSDTNKLTKYNNGTHGFASIELSSHKKDSVEIPSSKDRRDGASSPKLLSTCSHPFSGKSISCKLNVNDLEQDLGSHLPVELPECSKEHLDSSLTKETASDMFCGQRSASYTCGGTDDGSLIGGNSVASDKVCLNLEAERDRYTGSSKLPNEAVNSSEKIEEIEKVKEPCGLPDVQETSLQSHSVDDSDDFDILEHDVKVCDICGDAGREDLLAICSRCSDGAEHTYCMQEMMDKVPAGDWMCEECKFDDEIKNLKEDKIVTVDGNDKNQSSGLASALDTNLCVKSDKKDSDVEGNKTNKDILSTKTSGKRRAENIEVASAAKKQALEPTVGSPNTSSPRRVAALSHDSSFRNLNKGKVKPAHHLTSGSCSIKDTSEAAFSSTGPRLQTTRGEIKQQSHLPRVVEASLINGICSSAEQKANQTSLMDNPLSSTSTAERPSCNVNEDLPDLLPRPRESTNLGERIRESSVNRSRPSITTGGKSVPCQKCKEIGHSAQFCTVDSPQSLAVDASAASSREVMNKGNKLKAAIEAAMLKKPGIYRKNKMPDQSDGLSMSSANLGCQIGSQGQFSTSINTSNMFSANEVHDGQAVLRISTADSCRQTTVNNMNQLSALPSGVAILKTGAISPVVPSNGKPFRRDLPSHALASVSVLLKMSAVPEHEYIWQGGFEVLKRGKLPELHDGIQAHLSTCASPKVFDVLNKFPSKILLNEVPRFSMWPVQFQETGVKEDNIALYFFAKDLECYEKSYKSLLETMMKNDLALKGNFEGVELLIFPSNHLPEKSQRWNMLFFLWGVFRGKKVNYLQNVSGSPKKYFIHRDMPTAIMSPPENTGLLGPIDGNLPMFSKACNVALSSKCPALMESPCLSSDTINGNCDTEASSLDPKGQCLQENVGWQDCRIKTTSSLLFQETRCTSTPLETIVDPECKLDVKLQPSVQTARNTTDSKKSKKMPMYPDNPLDIQQISTRSFEIAARVDSSEDQVMFESTLKEEEGSLDTKAVLERDMVMRDQTMKGLNNRQFNCGKHLHEDPTWTVSQASAGISQKSWSDANSVLLDGQRASKKQKTGLSGLLDVPNSSRNTSPSRGSSVSGTYDMGTSSLMKEIGEKACNEKEILKNKGISERYFFPVDELPVKDLRSGENSVPWKVLSSEDDVRLPDVTPSLELALGAEMKPSKPGILPFLMGKVDLNASQDQPCENAATKEEEGEEEDVSACLSLSLSFPFPDNEQTAKPVLKVEQQQQQLLPDRRYVNSSLLFFDNFPDNK
ncbi:uncharacterized protein LOC114284471 isoform X4 [Camellia sinensis]|uniref:uncharacterized protein LOC114284471 isoform X4 n=1 Tax=Camellia sinensis TaxID=4442 RepID=UPI001036513C|nr:uncharacterized protein LOC114284471 isoform X4 [Camellia sinensis]